MTWPTKDDFVDGDVLTAAQVNNIADNLNLFDPTSATNGQVPIADGAGSVAWGAVSGGLSLVTSQSVTTSSNINIDSVFTSQFWNYTVIVDLTFSTTAQPYWRFRAGGVDYSTNASIQLFESTGTSTFSSRPSSSNYFLSSNTDTQMTLFINVMDPQRSGKYTRLWSETITAAGTPSLQISAIYPNTTVSWDGFRIYPSTGTMTGEINVYGWEQ